jgi:hypothetical protein
MKPLEQIQQENREKIIPSIKIGKQFYEYFHQKRNLWKSVAEQHNEILNDFCLFRSVQKNVIEESINLYIKSITQNHNV